MLDIHIGMCSEYQCGFFDIGHWTFTQVCTTNINVAFSILDIGRSHWFVQRISLFLFRYWTLDIHIALYSANVYFDISILDIQVRLVHWISNFPFGHWTLLFKHYVNVQCPISIRKIRHSLSLRNVKCPLSK